MKGLFSFLFAVLALNASADVLKSNSIRAQLCDEIMDTLEYEGIESTYDVRWAEPIELFPKFEQKCSAKKEAFVVTKTVMNERAKKVSHLEIDVDLKLSNVLRFKGKFSLSRPLFNPATGDIQVGKWLAKSNKTKFYFGKETFKKLAQILSSVGESDSSTFDVKNFSVKAELKKLNKEIRENNAEDGCIMTEAETYSLTDRETIFDYLYADSDTYVDEVLSFLLKKKQVKAIIFSTSEEWEESCAYHNIYIYLKSGTLVSLWYDFTT